MSLSKTWAVVVLAFIAVAAARDATTPSIAVSGTQTYFPKVLTVWLFARALRAFASTVDLWQSSATLLHLVCSTLHGRLMFNEVSRRLARHNPAC